MQVTIARQLGLEPTTVGNFFMNARRRSMDKWKEDSELVKQEPSESPPMTPLCMSSIPPTAHTAVVQLAAGSLNTSFGGTLAVGVGGGPIIQTLHTGQQSMVQQMQTVQTIQTVHTGATIHHHQQDPNL